MLNKQGATLKFYLSKQILLYTYV